MIFERTRLLVSPARLVLWDEFRGRTYTGPLAAELERWTGTTWVAEDARPLITAGRVLVYPYLGRCREPWLRDTALCRVRLSAPGQAALYFADRDAFEDHFTVAVTAREFFAPPYDDDHPPPRPPEPEFLRLLPGVAYPYAVGTRLIRGVVRRSGGPGLAGVLVQAVSPLGAPPAAGGWRERTLTGPDGTFRLALRGRGEVAITERERVWPSSERFTLHAYESPNRTAALDIQLDRKVEPPPYVMEIRE